MSNLKEIKRAIQYHRQQLGFERGRDSIRLARYYELAIDALEKLIPKKPTVIISEKDTMVGRAKFCKGTKLYDCQCGSFIGYLDAYCRRCGQKIDWEAE
ncbi:hypothetical protein EAL2_c10930 [Peptoclostridium acidaminophilum DSM 3953]|uniref:Uncharacterized protein n=1 Tax=Peptoclostridium acidaminophilum DSM 3953 TaxID=1286171 RepID=W8U642_PEPAC|nr:hypothetical protein [Peptoclostridium acidaminophilum]AHM56391.1 hypothetical protein EAL2_c10930 [Peptoclostridium acidaminophilum DSM 3953]